MKIFTKGFTIFLLIALMAVGMLVQYRVNSERFPNSPPWTRFFK